MLQDLEIEDINFVKKIPTTTHQIFKKFIINKNCWILCDKAFIYTLTDDRGDFNVITPKVPGKKDDFKIKH